MPCPWASSSLLVFALARKKSKLKGIREPLWDSPGENNDHTGSWIQWPPEKHERLPRIRQDPRKAIDDFLALPDQ
jgi:hypothetical protein